MGGIMVEVRRHEHDPRCANRDVGANAGQAGQSLPASIPPGLGVRIPPSTVA